MKRIVIACDGTWSRLDAEHPTNVAKLVKAVLPAAPDGVAQIVCHLDGVGTGRGTGWLARGLDRLLGGAFGQGLTATIEEAYRFLVLTYAPGDEVYLFGFSRGAFTARSLAGLIRNCGILDRGNASAIPEALRLYWARSPERGPDGERALVFRAAQASRVTVGAAEADWRAARGLPAGQPLRLAYLGVWDTVGALGVPGYLAAAAWLNRGLAFHDTALSRIVRAARHAVAIDERRRMFPPTLWGNLDALNAGTAGAPYAQCWFPGDHGAVGGGRAVSALSDGALVWVAEGAAAAGLALDPAAVAAWAAGRDCLGPLQGPPRLIWRLLAFDCRDRAGPRALGEVAEAALRRWRADPGYRPRPLRRLAAAIGGQSGRPGKAGSSALEVSNRRNFLIIRRFRLIGNCSIGGVRRRAGGFEEEPGAAFGLVDPLLDQAGGADVVVLAAGGVDAAQLAHQLAVVVGELGQHVLRVDVVGVVVGDALAAGDVADRPERHAAELAGAFGDRVGHREDLRRLLVEEQVEVAEVRARDVPVEVLGLDVEREDIGEERGEAGGDVADRVVAEVGAGAQARLRLLRRGFGHEVLLNLERAGRRRYIPSARTAKANAVVPPVVSLGAAWHPVASC